MIRICMNLHIVLLPDKGYMSRCTCVPMTVDGDHRSILGNQNIPVNPVLMANP